MSEAAARPGLVDGARLQLRVIGALVIREMHTRFGRQRLGYLWLFAEPLLLGGVIALLHGASGGEGIRSSFEFFSIGFMLFQLFRGIVARAPNTINANQSLLYHRQVTLPDLFFARHAIELAASAGVMALFVFAGIAMGGEAPDHPVKMILALVLMLLLAQGLAFMVGSITSEFEAVGYFIQVATFGLMPICGLMFMVEWLPAEWQEAALWVPTVHLFELMRDGQFGEQFNPVYDLAYVGWWIIVPHLLGLAGLRIARKRVGLD
ncbi:ABC transporter permease [Roseomonas sp. PWR1]|uniref:ABC transporter permease n=1 Tax=Roseomonas nitratireducens TaxID=2820810 RepID=A0ABS4AZS1_9PROT|nr:ABC transporter permease [Neoroseomonas nitratireducens]